MPVYQAIARHNLADFCIYTNPRYEPIWLHEEIARQLERVENGEVKRLMLFVPPRYGKSELASINFPAWYLGKHPEKEIIVASYSAELAQDFGYKTRNLVAGEEYGTLFDTRLMEDSKSKAKWLTKEKGGYTAVGVGGAITGRGANILLIDDPVKNREDAESETMRSKTWDWYTSTAYTRLEKNAAVILIMTRWHMDDLAGRLLKKQEEGGDKWEVIEFPAIANQDEEHRKLGEPLWPEKFNLETLAQTKSVVGNYDWHALYQQNPVATENQEFKPEFFQYRTIENVKSLDTRNFLTIDTAISEKASADYTGFCLNFVDRENKWNLKAWRMRISPKDLIDMLFSLKDDWNIETIGIEKTIYLQAIKPFLDDEMRKRNKFLRVVELQHNQQAKETRIRGLIPRYESKSIFYIKGECDDLEEEQTTFPKGIHDDTLDATAYQLQIAESVQETNFEPIPLTDW